jgi:hypothetical protein
MLHKPQYEELAHLGLSHKQLEVLDDIRKFLLIPHTAQQILSAEKTPTLSLALPLYEQMIEMFKTLESKRPKIAHAVRAARQSIEDYLAKARMTRAYSVAISKYPHSMSFI